MNWYCTVPIYFHLFQLYSKGNQTALVKLISTVLY